MRCTGVPFTCTAVACLALLFAGCRDEGSRLRPSPSLEDRRPNIVLFTFCTLRADKLGVYTGKRENSPFLYDLGKRSVVFWDNYTPATYTGGAFASIVTGKYPFHHGIYDHPLRLDGRHTTIAEALKAKGYRTAAFVTHGYLSAKFGFDQGFDHFSDGIIWRAKAALGAVPNEAEERVQEAVRWLRDNGARKLFVWIQLDRTHYPYRVLPDAYDPSDPKLRREFARFKSLTENLPLGRIQFEYGSTGLTETQTAAALRHYEAEVLYTDALVGRILDALEQAGIHRNTVIVVGADHGEAIGEKGVFFNHDANLCEPTVRVPLIIYAPGLEPGERHELTRNIDIYPTILELAGVGHSPTVDGTSLVPLMTGGNLDLTVYAETRPFVPRRAEFGNYPLELPGVVGKLRMIRRGAHKLIAHPTRQGLRFELYDLARDPNERHDFAGERPEVVVDLSRALEDWFANYTGTDVPVLEQDDETVESLQSLGYLD